MSPAPDWNLVMVRSREARRLLPKRPGTDQIDWGGMRVAHLDTGYTEHPAFGFGPGATPWLLPADGLNLLAAGPPKDPLDYEGSAGHGTRTCSILCGEAVPMQHGGPVVSEIGVAPRLPVVPCRIVKRVVLLGEESRAAVAAGIRHAIVRGCQVVSISLGVPAFPFWAKGGMGRAVDVAYEQGIIVVAAAGQFIDSVCYPGKYTRCIGVAGVDHTGRIWFGYRAGDPWIDVWAPAKDVLRLDSIAGNPASAVPPAEADDPAPPGFGSGSDSESSHSGSSGLGTGTSYATVHVAAAAAMWLRLRGDDLVAAYGPRSWKWVEAFRWLLRRGRTTRTITPSPPENRIGAVPTDGRGILDIRALLSAPLPAAADLTMAEKAKNMHL